MLAVRAWFIFVAYGGAQMISMPFSVNCLIRSDVLMTMMGLAKYDRILFVVCPGHTCGSCLPGYAGLFGSTIPVASAYIADVTTSEERPRYLGSSSVVALAFLIGPSIGGGLYNSHCTHRCSCPVA